MKVFIIIMFTKWIELKEQTEDKKLTMKMMAKMKKLYLRCLLILSCAFCTKRSLRTRMDMRNFKKVWNLWKLNSDVSCFKIFWILKTYTQSQVEKSGSIKIGVTNFLFYVRVNIIGMKEANKSLPQRSREWDIVEKKTHKPDRRPPTQKIVSTKKSCPQRSRESDILEEKNHKP